MSDITAPIPSPDSIALPGPEPLLHGLLVLGFLLHALFMNAVLGGTPIMLVTDWLGRRTGNPHCLSLGKTLAAVLPTAMALAVVLGVAPLLFIQALYGPFFFTAAILVGNVWIGMVGLLILGYYGLYLYRYGTPWIHAGPGLRLAIGVASSLTFHVVALVFVSVSVLMLNPEQWLAIRAEGLPGAIRLPSVLPRYLHMVLAALAGAGLLLMLYGSALQWGRGAGRGGADERTAYALWVVRYGAGWALAGTLPQAVVGPWLFLSLPPGVRAVLTDGAGPASLVFFTSLTFALLALVLLNATMFAPQARVLAPAGAGCLVVTIVLMAVIRDRVRRLWLAPHFDTATLAVTPQWGFIALFAVFLLVGLALIAYLIRAYAAGRDADAAPP